ncbi:MAG: HAD family hydrolase [Anaerolineales bacterium]|nr:HAD family hydrolase [Anaerolineales bacterium]
MPAAENITAILFDFDGTLRFNLPTAGEVFFEYVKSLNLQPFAEQDYLRAERWELAYFASSREIQVDYAKYKADKKGFWVNFTKRKLNALGLDENTSARFAPRAAAYMDQAYQPRAFVPDEVFIVLERLKSAGYTLGVVSNRDQPFREELDSLNLSPYFKFALAGGEVNSYKPEPLIFQRGLELAGASAAETLYIGDNYYADVLGALRSGLRATLYDPGNLFPEASEGCLVIQQYAQLDSILTS